jgi:hypothetical protein
MIGATTLGAVFALVALPPLSAESVLADPGVTAAVPAQPSAAETELAMRYAPVVRVRAQDEPCGHGEPYLPVDVDAIMGDSGVALRGPWQTDDLVDIAPTAEDLGAGLSRYHLDFPGNALAPGCEYEMWEQEVTAGGQPTVYARVVNDAARPGQVALQYWFFYLFNDWNNTHEGDWEMIQLVFDAPDAAAALTMDPVAAGYSQHTGGERAEWGSEKLEIVDETHPVVYPGEGSHANFFRPALYLGRSSDTGVGCDDTTEPHTEIRPRVAVAATDQQAYLAEFPWLGFRGHWGERHEAFFNGPTGPNLKNQWTEPIQWAESSWRDASVSVPAAAAVGPAVIDTFCAVVESASNLLREALRNPLPVLAALAIVVALVLVAAARTRWEPPDPFPLARERDSGQIVAAAAQVYRRHWRLHLGIGLVFVPTMLLAVGAQWLLVRITRLDVLAGPDGDQHAWAVFIVVLLGEAIALAAYFTVVAAVACSVHDLDRGEPPSPRTAYRDVVRRIGSIARVAIRIVAVVGVLLLFLVTAPLALFFAVRYALAIPALMIEDETVYGAMRRSRELVRGRWWRTALLLTVVVGVGAITGPLVGVALLFVSDASFVMINLVAGLVYAAAIPFVALVVVYAYYNLAVRAASDSSRASTHTGQ